MEAFIACFKHDVGALCVLPKIGWLTPDEQATRKYLKLLIGTVKKITETISLVQKIRIQAPDLKPTCQRLQTQIWTCTSISRRAH